MTSFGDCSFSTEYNIDNFYDCQIKVKVEKNENKVILEQLRLNMLLIINILIDY